MAFSMTLIIVSFVLIVPLDEQKGAERKMEMKLELVPVTTVIVTVIPQVRRERSH